MGRVVRHDLADDQPVEQHADRGELLLDRGVTPARAAAEPKEGHQSWRRGPCWFALLGHLAVVGAASLGLAGTEPGRLRDGAGRKAEVEPHDMGDDLGRKAVAGVCTPFRP
jgi:hypothetical protein